MHKHATVVQVTESEFFPGEYTAQLALARLYTNAPQQYGTLVVAAPDAVWPGQSIMVVGDYIDGAFIADRIFTR